MASKLASQRLAFWMIHLGALAFVAVLLLAGCVHRPAPVITTAPPPSEQASQSTVAAAVSQALTDAGKLDLTPARKSIELLLRLAASGLPIPSIDDLKRMAEISRLVFAGDLTAAEAKADTATRELAALRKQIEREREESAERMRQILADADRRIKAAEDAGERKAFLIMVTAAAITGGLISIGGALMAWMTTYKLVGVAFVVLGPCVPGAAMLWGKPWFYIPAGLGVLLLGLAFGIKLVWSILDRNDNGRVDFMEAQKNPAHL